MVECRSVKRVVMGVFHVSSKAVIIAIGISVVVAVAVGVSVPVVKIMVVVPEAMVETVVKSVPEVVVGIVVAEGVSSMAAWVSMSVIGGVARVAVVGIMTKPMLSTVSWETMVGFMAEAVLKSVSVESEVLVIESMTISMVAITEVIMVEAMAQTVIEAMIEAVVGGCMWISMGLVSETMAFVTKSMNIMVKNAVKTVSVLVAKGVGVVAKSMSIVAEAVVTPSIAMVSVAVVHRTVASVSSGVVVLFIVTDEAVGVLVGGHLGWDIVDVLRELMMVVSGVVAWSVVVWGHVVEWGSMSVVVMVWGTVVDWAVFPAERVVAMELMVINMVIGVGNHVKWDLVAHLLSKEDLREGKTDGVPEFVVVLVSPLCHSIHEFVVHILSIDDEVMVDVEDEIPWVGESL